MKKPEAKKKSENPNEIKKQRFGRTGLDTQKQRVDIQPVKKLLLEETQPVKKQGQSGNQNSAKKQKGGDL